MAFAQVPQTGPPLSGWNIAADEGIYCLLRAMPSSDRGDDHVPQLWNVQYFARHQQLFLTLFGILMRPFFLGFSLGKKAMCDGGFRGEDRFVCRPHPRNDSTPERRAQTRKIAKQR